MYPLATLILAVLISLQSQAVEKAPQFKYSMQELITIDSRKIERIVDEDMKPFLNEQDDEVFLNGAAKVLAQDILVHPNLTERQSGLSQLRGKLGDGELPGVFERAADLLLEVAGSAQGKDQASAFWALSNLIKEAKAMRKEDKAVLKDSIIEISQAKLSLSKEAKKYLRDAMLPLVEPDQIAKDSVQDF